MPVEVNMPRLGVTMESGTITHWYKKVGDRIEKGESIVDFETDKLNNTIESPVSGTLEKIFFSEGEEVECGGVLAHIAEGEDAADTQSEDKEELNAGKQDEEKQQEGKRVNRSIPLIGARKVISDRMRESLEYSPQGTTTCRVDVTNLLNFKKEMANEGKKYTVTELFVKSVSLAIQKNLIINSARIDDKIITYDSINIGVAVALEGNLLVPVIRESQNKSLDEISAEMKALIAQARDGKIDMENLKESTFTITNLGIYNVDYCTPLLNVPEAAILCIGRLRKEMTYNKDKNEFEPRDMMPLSMTSDHAVMDGAPVAKFLGSLAEILDSPDVYMV